MEISVQVYRPRRAKETPLYRLVCQHIEEFLAYAECDVMRSWTARRHSSDAFPLAGHWRAVGSIQSPQPWRMHKAGLEAYDAAD